MEKEFIRWLRQRTNGPSQKVQIAIGDDAAVFTPAPDPLVVASDSIADGTHFDTQIHSLRQIGRKAVAVNLSDIAAMGAKPLYATLSFFLPKTFTVKQAQELFIGAADLAEAYGTQVIGGDTNSWHGKLVVGATLIGQVEHTPWQMSGAVPGDAIVVTGEFGGSILGHHIDFEPKCQLAAQFASQYSINGATDVTDSLSYDLDQMCLLSGCGAEIELEKIPVSAAANELARSNPEKTELEHALYDGEDFELILAVPPGVVDEMMDDEKFGIDFQPAFAIISRNIQTIFPFPAGGNSHVVI